MTDSDTEVDRKENYDPLTDNELTQYWDVIPED